MGSAMQARNTSVVSFIVLANNHHMVKYTFTYTVGCNYLQLSPSPPPWEQGGKSTQI